MTHPALAFPLRKGPSDPTFRVHHVCVGPLHHESIRIKAVVAGQGTQSGQPGVHTSDRSRPKDRVALYVRHFITGYDRSNIFPQKQVSPVNRYKKVVIGYNQKAGNHYMSLKVRRISSTAGITWANHLCLSLCTIPEYPARPSLFSVNYIALCLYILHIIVIIYLNHYINN